jgi:hypothetical protein
MTYKRWLIPVAGIAAAAAVLAVTAVVVFRPAGSEPTPDRGSAEGIEPALCRVADDDPDECVEDLLPRIPADCPEEYPDCDDTVDFIDDGPIRGDPDEPVSNEPPAVIDPAPGDCSTEHEMALCERLAIQTVVRDLSERAGADPDQIALIGAEYVDWPDSSLGNPQPGMAYLQVITPGFKIVLEYDGAHYIYHTDTGSRAELVQ